MEVTTSNQRSVGKEQGMVLRAFRRVAATDFSPAFQGRGQNTLADVRRVSDA